MARRTDPKAAPKAAAFDPEPAEAPESEAEPVVAEAPEAPVDEAVASLLEEAGVGCPHTVKRSRYKGGQWQKRCEACGETWQLEA